MPIQIALDSLKQAASGTANSATFLRGDNTWLAANVAANSAIASPVFSGTATGTYTLAGTPTITNPTLTLQSENVSPFIGFRNRIINGTMVIDQRKVGASVTPTADGTYTLDRWRADLSVSSKYSVQRSSVAPAGFINSLLVTSLSAYSVGSSDYFGINQLIEGNNVADLNWGTANAKTVILSFWVRSSLTGTFGGSIRTGDGSNLSYPFTYSISAANTMEQKSITIVGPTTGTWQTGTAAGIDVWFSLGTGSTFSGTAGAWAAANLVAPTGATSVVGTNGATFYITGVQLERGSVASSFEFRPFGTELALCQRYFCKSAPIGTAILLSGLGAFTSAATEVTVQFPVPMRATPTVTVYDSVPTTNKFNYYSGGWQTNGTVYGAEATSELMADFNSANASWKCNFYASAEL